MSFPYKPRAGSPTESNQQVQIAQHIAVYESDDCTRRLVRHDRIRSSGIPVQLTGKSVEIRDGSLDFPVQLPALQKSVLASIPYLVGMLADGTLVAWSFGNFTGPKKIVVENGMATIKADYYSDLIDGNVCTEDNCENIHGMIGFKETVEICPGQPNQIRIQLVKAPKCCCDTPDGECTAPACTDLAL